ncbi:MAG: glycosyltransferase family 4 protein [Phycisphaerae bacterium]
MPCPRGTGRSLLDAYRLIPSLRPDWEFVLYHQRAAAQATTERDNSPDANLAGVASALLARPNVRARCIDIPGDRFDLWFQVRLPTAAWRDRIDLLHLPANVAPVWCPVPFVVTVHDLIPLTVPGEQPERSRRAFERGVARAVRSAAHIISPSKATRDELHRIFDVTPERITVIPWAPDQGITRAHGGRASAESPGTAARAEIERVRIRHGLNGAWLLNFSGSSPRKNAAGLMDAFARLSPDARRGVQLVLVGCEPASVRAALEARSQRLGVRASCRFLGFVPHEDLPGLLCGARGLLMPSLCEGFGAPILDAFACGAPVLTSKLSSMPEVAGDAAVYCDPHSAASIAEGIIQLLDQTIAQRLKRAGVERLRSFSWERTVRLMCEVYERCVSKPLRCETGRALSAPEATG